MEAKDVALLGFVSSARNYINRHINDGTNLDKLNKFDINTLDSELSKQLKYFDGDQDTINSLLKAGDEAFVEYAKEKIEKKNNGLFESLGEVFDLKVNKIEIEPEIIQKETKTEEPKPRIIREELNVQNEQDNIEIIKEVSSNEPDEFGLLPDDKFLKAIEEAASRSNEELEKYNPKVLKNEKMDDVFNDVVVNEGTKNSGQSLSEQLKGLAHKEDIQNEQVFKQKDNVKEYSSLSESLRDISRGNDPVYYTGAKEKVSEYNNQEIERRPSKITIIENPGLDIIEPKDTIDIAEFEEHEVIENPAYDYDQNVSNTLAALQDFVSNKETDSQEEIDEDEELYESIAKAYPYLNMKFIKSAYKLRDTISNGITFGEKIIILHRIIFEELENLQEFVEIIMEHGYSVNVDERQMIVDTFKEFNNENGLILANIYTMANQARVLNGEYEGYRVIKEEEE